MRETSAAISYTSLADVAWHYGAYLHAVLSAMLGNEKGSSHTRSRGDFVARSALSGCHTASCAVSQVAQKDLSINRWYPFLDG